MEEVIARLNDLGLSQDIVALSKGMLLGDKSLIDPEMIKSFRTSGMSHLLAVSGLHVGVIMSLVWLLLRPVETLVYLVSSPSMNVYYATGIVKRILTVFITWTYVWFIGAPISAIRAALMLSLCLIGWMIHRPTSAWNCLVLAALILLALDPWNITQVGFQLSFLAVAGILLFQPWLQSEDFRWWERLAMLSISAQWLTLPVVAFYFHQVPFLGWLQGILVVPLIPIFVSFLLLGVAFPSLHFLCAPIEILYGWITWIATQIGKWEQMILGGHLYFYPSFFEALLAEVALLSLVLWLRIRRNSTHQTKTV